LDLEKFLNFPPLSTLYKNCYTQKDFDIALAGLNIFDDKNEFGVFANQDFLDEAEAMRKLYPESKLEKRTDVETVNAENIDTEDKFELMNRDELKEYSRTNKTGVAIHSKLTDDDLRALLKEWDKLNNGEDQAPDDKTVVKKTGIDEIPDKHPSVEGVKTKNSSGLTAAERIALIRNGNKK
jgi:hypothetical protein